MTVFFCIRFDKSILTFIDDFPTKWFGIAVVVFAWLMKHTNIVRRMGMQISTFRIVDRIALITIEGRC